jgi:hypothetical protein
VESLSKCGQGLCRGQSVGHVSLETNIDYISFWPSDTTYASGHFMNNLEDDLKAEEGRNPEVTIFLRHPQEKSSKELREDFSFLQWLHKKGNLYWTLHGEVQSLKHKCSFTEDLKLLKSPRFSPKEQYFFGYLWLCGVNRLVETNLPLV